MNYELVRSRTTNRLVVESMVEDTFIKISYRRGVWYYYCSDETGMLKIGMRTCKLKELLTELTMMVKESTL